MLCAGAANLRAVAPATRALAASSARHANRHLLLAAAIAAAGGATAGIGDNAEHVCPGLRLCWRVHHAHIADNEQVAKQIWVGGKGRSGRLQGWGRCMAKDSMHA